MPINFSTSGAVSWWRPSAWLRVSGADAATFLQGQFTNELRNLALGAAAYGLWLSVKGKVLADSFVLRGRGGDEFWIGSYFSSADVIRERLEQFVIADDVTIEDMTGGWRAVTLVGVARFEPVEVGFTFTGRRGREPAIEWVFPTPELEQVRAAVGAAPELAAEAMERRRIEAGIPAVPKDIGPDDLPNEGGLEVEAISFTKGCYLGQEVMARLKSMGQVRRRLMLVRGVRTRFPPLPAPLFLGAKQVGELRSAASLPDGLCGLALVSLLHVPAAGKLALAPGMEPDLIVTPKP